YSPFFSPRPSPPTPTLFPYTTLFRSDTVYTSILLVKLWAFPARKCTINFTAERRNIRPYLTTLQLLGQISGQLVGWWMGLQLSRSEEHTSELQSRENLVCRLLLEKKN